MTETAFLQDRRSQ